MIRDWFRFDADAADDLDGDDAEQVEEWVGDVIDVLDSETSDRRRGGRR